MALPAAEARTGISYNEGFKKPELSGLLPVKYYPGGVAPPFHVFEHALNGESTEFWDSVRRFVASPGRVVRGLVLPRGESKHEIEKSVIILAAGVQESRYLYNAYVNQAGALSIDIPIPQGTAIPFEIARHKNRVILTILDGKEEIHRKTHKAFAKYLDRNTRGKIELEKDKGKRRLRIFGNRSSSTVRL